MVQYRYGLLLLIAALLFPLVSTGQVDPKKTFITPQCPQDGDSKANSGVNTFTSYGTCDVGDMVYGVMFDPKSANPDFPIGYGSPGPGDHGGSDGKWTLRFPGQSDGARMMRVIGWMSNESKDTNFTVDHTQPACTPPPGFVFDKMKQPKGVRVAAAGNVKLDDPAPTVTGTTKMVTLTGTVNSAKMKVIHAEITRIVTKDSQRQVEVVQTWKDTVRTKMGSKLAVSITYDLSALTTGDIYKVRLSATNADGSFNDFDVKFLAVP